MGSGATKRGPEEIKDVVGKIIGRLKKARAAGEEDILSAWNDAAGRRAARHTQPVSLRKGVLTVAVDGSAWLYHLTMEKQGLLARLRGSGPQGITDIKFRIK